MTAIRPGGLMRCCIATIEARAGDAPIEGERLECLYCKSREIVFHDGAWEWDKAQHTREWRKP
jgi:hypothetical protein